MRRLRRIPWKRVADFLEVIEQERTIEGFIGRTMQAIEALVGFDFSLNAFTTFDDVRRLKTFLSFRAPDSLIQEYMERYGAIDPWLPRQRQMRFTDINWRAQRETEFEVWVHSYGLRYTVGLSNLPLTQSEGYVLALHRQSWRAFNERDRAILSVLYPHLNNFAQAVGSPDAVEARQLKETGAAVGLTPREQDVAMLLAQRLPTPEIAERLFISRHTVEKHVEHIYGKLKASGRKEARRRLLEGTLRVLRFPWRRWIVDTK